MNILQSLKEGLLQLYKEYDAVQFKLKMPQQKMYKINFLAVWFGLILQPFLIAVKTEENCQSQFKLPPVEEPVKVLSFARICPEFEESLPEMF